jgi:putative endonuclease
MDTCLPAGREWRSPLIMMTYVVYALQSTVDKRIYVGLTKNLEKRIKEHNQGKTKSTKGFRPWLLIFQENFETRIDARKREKYYKSGVGKEFLKKQISVLSFNGYLPAGRQGMEVSY